MNAPGTILRWALLGWVAYVAGLACGCTSGLATPIVEIRQSAAGAGSGGAHAGMGGVNVRAGSGGVAGSGGLGGMSGMGGMGGRSELQAGSGDRLDICPDPVDPAEAELLEALNVAIENKLFCPFITRRLTMSEGARCFARSTARDQGTDRGRYRPQPPGWSQLPQDQNFMWFGRQAPTLADAQDALLSPEGPGDRREDLCAAAQRGALYKVAGVGRSRDNWVVVVSVYDR